MFALPLLLPISFAAGGQLFLSEVVLLLALPFLTDDARRRGVSRVSHTAVALGCLWLLGLILTDIYRGTSFHDYSRGWANAAFLVINYAGLALLVDGRWRRVRLFAAGLAIGEILQFFLNPSIYGSSYPWKFGYGDAATLAGVLLASNRAVYHRPLVATGILITLGIINLKMGFRSLGGVCLLTSLVVMFAGRSGLDVRLKRRAFRVVVSLAVSVLAGFLVVGGYGFAASHGLLGGRAQQKYSSQKGNLGVVVGGRPEIISEALAIRDSPIVGHGSWAKDPKYGADLQNELFRAGYTVNTKAPSSGLIPTHSYLFGAWVDAGILGAVFWVCALAVAISVLLRAHRFPDGRVALVAFLAFAFLWDVLFSPLGAQARLTAAFALVVFLMARKDLSTNANMDGPTR